MVERLVRDEGVAGSSPVAPTTVVRIPVFLLVLLGVLWAGLSALAIAGLVVWSDLCSGPRVPDATHTVAHSCHGTVAYVTPLVDDLWYRILPAVFFVLFIASTGVIVAIKIRITRSATPHQ